MPLENKPLSAAFKIAAVLAVNLVLKRFVLPVHWNGTIRYIIIVIIILFLFRFRFTKAENFRISRNTAIIALICSVSVIAVARHLDVRDILQTVFVTAFFEELIYRGYITNELFRLKQSGLKTTAAIAISAALFGFIHIDGIIGQSVAGTFAPDLGSTAVRFFSAAGFGLSFALILYHKKDVISAIFIHAVNNILAGAYYNGGESAASGALYAVFAAVFVVGYPAFLTLKRKLVKPCR